MSSTNRAEARIIAEAPLQAMLPFAADLRAADLHALESRLERLQAEIRGDAGPQLRPLKNIATVLRWFVAADIAAFIGAFVCAWGLAAFINNLFFGRSVYELLAPEETTRLAIYLTIAAALILWFEHTGHYRARMPFWMETQKIITALGFAMVIDGFSQFAIKEDFSRLWLMSSWLFAAAGIIILRSLTRALLRRAGRWNVRALLVGHGASAEDARLALASEPELGYEIVAQAENVLHALRGANGSWAQLCASHETDYVIVALDGKELGEAEEAMAQLMREAVPFSIAPPLRHLPVGLEPHYFFNSDVMLMARNNRLEQPLPRLIKRGFDLLASSAVLILSSPMFLALAVLVRADGGPVFYGHKRLGRNGKPFSCFKFRSMAPDADRVLEQHLAVHPEARAEWQREWKLRDDPRVTRIGRFLRRWSLDELPQLFNVLKGDMSLVGPRPIVVGEIEKYDHDIAHYHRVRPGITGIWQVSGRNDVSYRRRVQMDSWYARNWSLWHDIVILCKTVPVLLKRTGAY